MYLIENSATLQNVCSYVGVYFLYTGTNNVTNQQVIFQKNKKESNPQETHTNKERDLE